jgi:chromosome segregation ATPase
MAVADAAKLADARKRVTRAERKALDRALALRDQAEALLESARGLAARIRDDAKSDAARIRDAEAEAARAAPEDAPSAAATTIAELQAALETARAETAAARDERDVARAEIGAAQEDAKAARDERDRARSAADEHAERWSSTAALQSELNAARERIAQLEAGAGDREDLLALVALVEAVEAERDALAAELDELRGTASDPEPGASGADQPA